MQDITMVPDGEKWEFDASVERVFENMLNRSIPGYMRMRKSVYSLGRNFIKPGTAIIDIGCSNGLSAQSFVDEYYNQNEFYLYDISEPMLKAAAERYQSKSDKVHIEYYDLRSGIPQNMSPSLVLSILTIQFTPIEYRKKIVRSIYDALEQGGALILVEKVLGETEKLDDLFVDEYYKIKAENQYTQQQIQSKRKSLEGVLVPLTSKWNEDLLRSAGFDTVECFWRELNFAGWIAIK